ncbi:cell wall metabolism sensor histidine kinase WalK [Geobacter sp. SVR]|uniref:sensor histidine kinase n=1 Tax=Geobacter sp. SVR TaxID=2495594 RepID=UPI00143F038A|nr:HAMP domain-containing sensor histidine kinase [Geobacter sp. SVR]BCS55066.1 two-component sensor histidine kinase [Geobacter sp. SVR]GCF85248.1 two-component sensor histidine kinase [Geobacter sp. SVR]
MRLFRRNRPIPCEEGQCASLRSLHDHFHQHRREFIAYHRYFRYARPFVLLFNIVILYLLFRWAGIKAIGVFFAVLIVFKELFMFVFLRRLEKRIITPIQELRRGVDQIADGKYDVRVACQVPNDLGLLIVSFNEMAHKLQKAEQLKSEYEENRKSLITNISHDLKTPIAAIQGYIEAVLEGEELPPEKRDKYLRTIYHNVSYLNHLIDDLFLFSKLDMQKLEFNFVTVPIRSYIADLMEEYQLELEGLNIPLLISDTLTDNPQVCMDCKRMYQAINNIVRNAVGHGPDQGLSLRVTLYRKDAMIALDIRDNGPGIPQDKLPHIFARFYRIDTERTKNFESTGLGLAITKELVQAHGGKVAVWSREGEGTCFTIMLPEYSGWGNEDEKRPDHRG